MVMVEPTARTENFPERLQNGFADVLFPRVTPAEIMLFFYILLAHALTFHPAIGRWTERCVTNVQTAFVETSRSIGGISGFVAASFECLYNSFMLLWMFILILFAVLGIMGIVFHLGFSGREDMLRDKELTALASGLFYLTTASLTAYLLYLHIVVSGLFAATSWIDTLQYVLIWVFFLRQVACGLFCLPLMDWEAPWVQDFMATRVRQHAYPWLVLVVSLMGATVFYILLRRTYAVGWRAVAMAFIYADILLHVIDRTTLRVPGLARIHPPFRSKARTHRAEPFRRGPVRRPTLRSASRADDPRLSAEAEKAIAEDTTIHPSHDRSTAPHTLREEKKKGRARPSRAHRTSPAEPNAVCSACGATYRIDTPLGLSRGAYLPCPVCRGRLNPLTKTPVTPTETTGSTSR